MRFAPKLAATLLVLATCACRPPAPQTTVKIVDGEEVAPGDPLLRYTAALTKPDGRFFCSAVLVHRRMLATAAHCLKPGNMAGGVRVVFGPKSRSGTTYNVVRHELHPQYSPANNATGKAPNDLGVVYLGEDVPLSVGKPVAVLNDAIPVVPFKTEVVIAGYGITASGAHDGGTLRFTKSLASALPDDAKELYLDSLGIRNACQGDSGGPAVVRHEIGESLIPYLVGVASYVITTTSEKCESGLAAYTDARQHRSWLQSKLP